jgi:hypothetical protein
VYIIYIYNIYNIYIYIYIVYIYIVYVYIYRVLVFFALAHCCICSGSAWCIVYISIYCVYIYYRNNQTHIKQLMIEPPLGTYRVCIGFMRYILRRIGLPTQIVWLNFNKAPTWKIAEMLGHLGMIPRIQFPSFQWRHIEAMIILYIYPDINATGHDQLTIQFGFIILTRTHI